jgi:hypothetical protein
LHSRDIHDTAKEWLESDDPVKKAWAFWYSTNGSFNNRIGAGYAYNFIDQSKCFVK